MAVQQRRRSRVSVAPLQADEQALPSKPQAANDAAMMPRVVEARRIDPAPEAPAAGRSCVRAALRAEALCRGLRLSHAEFARRYGPPAAIVRNWAPRQAMAVKD